MWRITAAILVLVATSLVLTEPAHAAGPTPSLVNTKVTIELEGDEQSSITHLLLSNEGDAGDVTIQFIDTASGKPLQVQQVQQSQGPAADNYKVFLPAHKVTPIELRVTTGLSAVEGHIVIQPNGAKAAIGSFVTARKPADAWLWLPFLGGAAALIIVVLAWLAPGEGQAKLGKSLGRTIDWKFNESWASSFTSLAAVTGTVLGLSGFLNDVLRGVVVTRFVGLNALFLASIAAAPLVFSAFARKENETRVGTVGGFLAAGWLTLTAAFGELVVLGVMLYMARGENGTWLIAGMLVAAGIILTLYAWRSIGDTVTFQRSHTGSGAGVTRMLKSEAESKPAEARVSLL